MSNLRIYCQQCGHMHSYTMHKPNFCQSCGCAMGSEKTTASKEQVAPKEENPSFDISSINALAFEAEHNQPTSQTLGSIMEASSGQGVENGAPSQQRPKRPKEEVLEELQRESKTLRPNS